MTAPRIVSRAEWLEARRSLLEKEKVLTAARDRLAAERRRMPWVRLDKAYVFETPAGRRSLSELFGARSQLVVYHFMLGPEWKVGCKSCSFWADGYDRLVPHLADRDVALTAVSRAPLAAVLAFQRRMGWTFPWVSSLGNDFNFDFGVSFRPEDLEAGRAEYNYAKATGTPEERPGFSVFAKDADGAVCHTYSTYARGLDPMNAAYQILDLVPKGRNEAGLPWPMQWVRLRDEYGLA